MNEITIVTLSDEERKILKKRIRNIKIDEKENERTKYLEECCEELKTGLRDNKLNRLKCFEDSRKRKISNRKYEELMSIYELEGDKFELELSLIERKINIRKFLLKRVDYLYLILFFYDGTTNMAITTKEGNKKHINIDDLYHMFLNQVLESEKERLDLEHKIMQLYMLINTKHNNIDEKSKYYLSDEEKSNTYTSIYENRTKSREVENNQKNIGKIDINRIIVDDFFNEDIDEVYEHLFSTCLKQEKSLKNTQ